MKKFKWYRKLLGGCWAQYEWVNWQGKRKSEWRKVHNGIFVEWKKRN